LSYNNISFSGTSQIAFRVFPGASQTGQTAGDSVFVSSWQIEFSDQATDYQDPTTIKSFQGEALVSSVSYDAGVEDNLTCSASFTGTGDIFINGLGPELIGDTDFDDSNYWDAQSPSQVQNGFGKLVANSGSSADSYIQKSGIINSGDRYLLTYTIPSSSHGLGNIKLVTSIDLPLIKTVGTHKLEFVANNNILKIATSESPTNIYLSSISLKKVF
jgi:hypothetical protein